MEEIDLKELLFFIKDKIGLLITITAAVCLIGCMYGLFIQTIVDFLIIALCIFAMIKFFEKFKKKEEPKKDEPPKKSDEVLLLEEIRDLLKKKTK